MTKGQATLELSAELMDMTIALEKAQAMIEEMTDGYFCYTRLDDEERVDSVVHEYCRYQVYSEILLDYIVEANRILGKVALQEKEGAA